MASAKKSINIPSIVKNFPQSASVISKLLKPEATVQYNPAELNYKDITTSIKEKISNNDDIVTLFPDIELAIQVLVSSVLAPNDMVNVVLHYKAPEKIVLPTNVKQQLLDTIERYMDNEYNIAEKLPTILREALFTKGAYVEAVIPEASLDDAINQVANDNITLESYLKSNPNNTYLSNRNHSYYISTESKGSDMVATVSNVKPIKGKHVEITQEDLGIQITDNLQILMYSKKMLDKKQKIARERSSKAMKISSETVYEELDRMFRPDSTLVFKDYIEIQDKDNASRESIGSPLVMKLPVEAVIPIHVTSDPSKHLGYFIILDENGNPVNIKDDMMNYQEAMGNTLYFNNSATSNSLIQKAKLALQGFQRDVPVINELETMYNDIVENMIKTKLREGEFGELADLKYNADVFKVMFSRSLKAQQTKVLFLPRDLVAYYAFEYRDNGTGKSLIEKNTLLYSIKAMLMFARLMASIKNSINTTVVSATLDENDPDPEATREKIISESLKTRQSTLPLGLIRPDDLTEWTHKVGFMYKIQHPALPNMELDVTDTAPSKTVPDEELDNKITERILMSYGLTPEIVMSGYSSDFATTVASKNLLFAKRCTSLQLGFMAQVTEHVRKIARNDFNLINKLTDIIKTNIKEIKKLIPNTENSEDDINFKRISEKDIIEYLLDKYINHTDISLPAIVMTDAAALKNSFTEFKANLEEIVDAVFTSTTFSDKYAGKLSEEIDGAKDIFKATAILEWLSNNNYMPEITDVFIKDDEGNPTFDLFGQYLSYKDTLADLVTKFAKDANKSKTKSDKALTKALEDLGGGDGGMGDTTGDGGDSYGGSGEGDMGSEGGSEFGDDEGASDGGDMGGSDDFGDGSDDSGSMDMGSGDESPSESSSEGEADTGEEPTDTNEPVADAEEPTPDEGTGEPEPTDEHTEPDTGDEPDTGSEPTTTTEEPKESESSQDEGSEPEGTQDSDEGTEPEEKDNNEKENKKPTIEDEYAEEYGEEFTSLDAFGKRKFIRDKEAEKKKEDEEKERQQKEEEEEKKRIEEEEKAKRDQAAEEAYQLDFSRTRTI